MGVGFLGNLTKHLTLRRSFIDSGVWVQSECKSYARGFHKIKNIWVSKSSSSSSSSLSIRNFSSSSSKMGLLGWYLRKLETRPLVTKGVTSSLIFVAADLTSQVITMSSPAPFDLVRTARMAGYGMFILGPSQHVWFNFVARILPKRDMVTTLKKLVLGQVFYGPVINTVFFTFNATLQGESGSEIVARLKRDLFPTLLNGLAYWPLCDFLTYKVIPVHLQPLMNSSFSYVWTIYLTYMASLTMPEDE